MFNYATKKIWVLPSFVPKIKIIGVEKIC